MKGLCEWRRVGHKPGSVLLNALPLEGQSFKRAVIYLGHLLPSSSSGRAEMGAPTFAWNGSKTNPCSAALLPTGVYRASTSRCCWCALTAPLHPYQKKGKRKNEKDKRKFAFYLLPFTFSIGGIFLWHYPHDRSHWALPSKFGLSEARTFLGSPFFTVTRNCLRLLSSILSLVCEREDVRGLPPTLDSTVIQPSSGVCA